MSKVEQSEKEINLGMNLLDERAEHLMKSVEELDIVTKPFRTVREEKNEKDVTPEESGCPISERLRVKNLIFRDCIRQINKIVREIEYQQ